MLPTEAWQKMFEDNLENNPLNPAPVAAMQVIQESLLLDDSTTLQELIDRMKFVRNALTTSVSATVCVASAGELFARFITRAPTDIESAKTIGEVRDILISRGVDFIDAIINSPKRAGKILNQVLFQAQNFIVFTHGRNECVLHGCIEAKNKGKTVKVFVTEGQPKRHGAVMVKELRDAGVMAELVLDSALVYYMVQSHYVVVGAESVCINGGVIGPIGTATVAAAAKWTGHSLYVATEAYRLSESYTPLNNKSLTLQQMYGPQVTEKPLDVSPRVDYTPPEIISRFYSDVGQFHAEAVQDNINLLYT